MLPRGVEPGQLLLHEGDGPEAGCVISDCCQDLGEQLRAAPLIQVEQQVAEDLESLVLLYLQSTDGEAIR